MATLRTVPIVIVLLLGLCSVRAAFAQCILANPSFEIAGSAGQTFAGWNQFGPVGSTTTNPTHGAVAARVSGPNTGVWDVAGYWQPQTTTPGTRWSASVNAWHSAAKPLLGQAQAILNIEWRNSSGALINYESHTVANASTPLNQVQSYSILSQPAPAGTATTRLVLGVLQGPTDPAPDVFFDQATFESQAAPTLDQKQWGDFPGGATLAFSGRTWRVKGPGYYGPGPNLFCDTGACTWVDASDHLHLTVQKIGSSWYSSEVTMEDVLGYGDYIFTTIGRLDLLDPNVVFGIFLWQYGPCYDVANGWWNPYNEIDVEYSRWGNPSNDVAQFVAQPYDYAGNINRFAATFSNGERTSHAFRWSHDRVEYRSWRGGPFDESPATLIHAWTYTGPHIPRPEQPRIHLNLWQFSGPPITRQEVVLERFTYGAPCAQPPCVIGVPDAPAPGPRGGLAPARPNPFQGSTTIRFAVDQAGPVELAIYDVSGRLVRGLVHGAAPAGDQQVSWDGRDDAGRHAAAGVYLYRLRLGNVVQSKRVILLR